MTSNFIFIRNIYVMMAYAFRAIQKAGDEHLEVEQFDKLHDLFAEILVRGVGTQVKRGLHHDYLHRREELATVRGRIDVSRSISEHSRARGRLICSYDEYDSDTPHNRALKSVIILLVRHGEIRKDRKEALRRLLPYLDAVTTISPTSIRWNTLTYHRSNASYRLLLGACELVVRGLLPTEGSGNRKLTTWLSDDAMSQLYERFLMEYFIFHHRELSPSAPHIDWDYDYSLSSGTGQLPAMKTDLRLRGGHKTLIVDAKYYSKSMHTGQWGKESVSSSNLYQILAYTKNADIEQDGSVSGLLMYARTDAPSQPDLDMTVQGSRIGARTLDLNVPWNQLRTQLDGITEWLES
ncbi:5-methylcytosine-specific restriction endonuclease system specificity protein McrC [Dietzia psychralcaliphila]|uniref:Restriction endonuclease n=1 Tax=Dietzia psychralcaliphila TaxID=139021 RepID=A0AAD0NNI0_9ACTN|nr:5-methylcytosine-specific restriction endonuclease system specificity protein McrC [Dietzia psychralcaliphila]AWH95937.1 restriction endonuclease [Dietzia psychralcaliphila]